MMTQTVNVVGAGLAGSEAAYQLVQRGVKVNLVNETSETNSSSSH